MSKSAIPRFSFPGSLGARREEGKRLHFWSLIEIGRRTELDDVPDCAHDDEAEPDSLGDLDELAFVG